MEAKSLEDKIQPVTRLTVAHAINEACDSWNIEANLSAILERYSHYSFSNWDEELRCIRLVRDEENEHAVFYLVLRYWKRIVKYAYKHTPNGFPVAEALEIYVNAVIRAIEKFNEDFKSFWPYASYSLWSASSEIKRKYENFYPQTGND